MLTKLWNKLTRPSENEKSFDEMMQRVAEQKPISEPKIDNSQKDTFTDPRDGKKYKYVKIGTQTWMAENLNYECEGSRYYDDDPANGQKYGRLYTLEAAKEAAPPGWHLPSGEEWNTLVIFVDINVGGKKLKARSGWNNLEISAWDWDSDNSTDDYGFAALPGGKFDESFYGVGDDGFWWSSTYTNISEDYYRWSLGNVIESIDVWSDNKDCFLSVRCIKD